MNSMKLSLMIFALLLLFFPLPGMAARPVIPPAGFCKTNVMVYSPEQVRILGADPRSPVVKDLFDTFTDLVQASNSHAIEGILKHYSPQFISGDNLSLDQVRNLILETWKSYPDICYDSKPVEIRVSGDWATIETFDCSVATAPPDKDILDIPGKLASQSRSLLFFRRMGKAWEITSDATLWEQAVIRYGIGDDVPLTLSAPEQVKAGESYSVTIQAQIPEGTFSIATIDNQPLIYPHEKPDDKFRTLSTESRDLQRVLTANTRNRNEIVTATLGLTSLEQKDPERPSLSLNGIATLVKRVNVVPISVEDAMEQMKKRSIVKYSADGKINLAGNNNGDNIENAQPYELELVPSTVPDAETDEESSPSSPADEEQE